MLIKPQWRSLEYSYNCIQPNAMRLEDNQSKQTRPTLQENKAKAGEVRWRTRAAAGLPLGRVHGDGLQMRCADCRIRQGRYGLRFAKECKWRIYHPQWLTLSISHLFICIHVLYGTPIFYCNLHSSVQLDHNIQGRGQDGWILLVRSQTDKQTSRQTDRQTIVCK
jgi:hypothetical protein